MIRPQQDEERYLWVVDTINCRIYQDLRTYDAKMHTWWSLYSEKRVRIGGTIGDNLFYTEGEAYASLLTSLNHNLDAIKLKISQTLCQYERINRAS